MATITSTELGASGSYIDLGSPSSLDDLGSMTIIAYIKPTAVGGTNAGYLFGKTPSGSTAGPRFYIGGSTTSTFRVAFGASSSTSGSPNNDATATAGAVAVDTWQHVEATWDGTIANDSINTYVDGTLAQSGTHTAGTGSVSSDASNPAFLLNRYGLARHFVGDVAYVAVWDRVLDSTERGTVRSGGPLDVPTGLVLLWANQEDLSASNITESARSTYVAGDTPPNTDLGGDSAALDIAASALSISGTVTASGDIESSTDIMLDLSASAIALSGTVAISGDIASAVVVKGVQVTLYDGIATRPSLTGLTACWWDAVTPHTWGAPDYATNAETTDASGVLEVNLSSVTSLALAAKGFLLVYKADGTDTDDSLVFAGQVPVVDIA